MKKPIIIAGIVIAVLIGTVSGVVTGAPVEKPTDTWQYIADAVDEILTKLTDVESNLAGVHDEVSALSNNQSSMARCSKFTCAQISLKSFKSPTKSIVLEILIFRVE